MTDKLKGRILERERYPLNRAFDASKKPLVEKMRVDIAQSAFDIFKAWAADKAPPADLEVLARYGHVSQIEGVNVRYYDETTRHWDKTFGVMFPAGCTIAMPEQRFGGKYQSIFVGGPLPEDGDNIPELLPLMQSIVDGQSALKAESDAFATFLGTKPMRQAIVDQYPDVVPFIWQNMPRNSCVYWTPLYPHGGAAGYAAAYSAEQAAS